MPPDSLYQAGPQSDSFRRLVDSLVKMLPPASPTQIDPGADSFASWGPLFVIVIMALALVLPGGWRNFRIWGSRLKVLRIHEQQKKQYHAWLQQFNPYYKNLPPDLKNRFMKRLIRFKSLKRFHFIEMQEDERISVLVSAAAIQIGFGLKNYLLAYFNDIYIMRRDYHYGLYNVPFEGHVSSNGIYLSWNNFEKAFDDYTDGSNVGLHEMAHALAYVNFIARIGRDKAFRRRFRHFSKTGRKVFGEMQSGKMNILGTYAATNYHEFWAVCIENFFEKPQALQRELPQLYRELTVLLNQDPLSVNILVKPIE
jgi:Mlc titration factor MtfA (ptsG expression regulator)